MASPKRPDKDSGVFEAARSTEALTRASVAGSTPARAVDGPLTVRRINMIRAAWTVCVRGSVAMSSNDGTVAATASWSPAIDAETKAVRAAFLSG